MGSYSIWHWLFLMIFSFIWIVPCWRIVSRAGFPGWITLFTIIPFVGLVLLWVFALIAWPAEKSQEQ
jgi:hypothetical protein